MDKQKTQIGYNPKTRVWDIRYFPSEKGTEEETKVVPIPAQTEESSQLVKAVLKAG